MPGKATGEGMAGEWAIGYDYSFFPALDSMLLFNEPVQIVFDEPVSD
jgi:hypothetical protein